MSERRAALAEGRPVVDHRPHLEEAYRFVGLVSSKPPLRATTGIAPSNARNDGPFGEVMANDIVPTRQPSSH